VFAVLYLAATAYLVFRDDLLAASLARQARMQHAYEDRIAALRSDIDRLTSRQLLNQEEIEAQMAKLLGRQAVLDTRQDIIAGLSQAARRVGLAPLDGDAADPPQPDEQAAAPPTPPQPFTTGALMPAAADDGPQATIDDVAVSLDALARDQVAYVDAVADTVAAGTDRIAAALKRIGHEVPRHAAPAADVGGPFVGLDEDADPETFRAGVDLITGELERFAAIRRYASQLPLAQPIPGAVVTSRYGTRVDPFLGRPAIHTGVDFRSARGLSVPATAGGTVIFAGPNGGYGRMVEIDHGRGVTTRFAHLSEVLVTVGQVVSKGTIVGKAGSTGRSTGPHLHYEVRVDGAAVNPMSYIAAGSEIAPLL